MSIPARLFFGILFLCALIVLPVQAQSVTKLYDINFNAPLHTVGQPPAVGPFVPTCKVVQETQGAFVVDSFGEFSDQPCVLATDQSCHSYLYLDMQSIQNSYGYPFSRYRVEVDIQINSLTGPNDHLRIDAGGEVFFFPDGRLAGSRLESFDFNRPIHVTIHINLYTRECEFVIEGNSFSGGPQFCDDLLFHLYGANSAANQVVIDNLAVYGVSNSQRLTVTYPRAGDGFTIGKTYPITWYSSSDVKNVEIGYSTDNGLTWSPVLPANAGNAGVYNWTIPDAASDFCKLRLTDATTGVMSESEPFRICEPVPLLPAYEVVDLRDVFGEFIAENAQQLKINDRGDFFADDTAWSGGQYYKLPPGEYCDINNRGQVLITTPASKNFIWQDGAVTNELQYKGDVTTAAINNSGSVLGVREPDEMFLWAYDSGYQIIENAYSSSSVVYDLNDNNQILGWCYHTEQREAMFFLWDSGIYRLFEEPYWSCTAIDFNNSATAVFRTTHEWNGDPHVALLRSDRFVRYGAGDPVALNDQEMVLAEVELWNGQHVYEIKHRGERFNLNELAGVGASAELHLVDLNNTGRVIGTYRPSSLSDERPCLLVPQSNRELTSLVVLGPDVICAGSVNALRAVGIYSDNCPAGLTELVTWTVSPSQAGHVDSEGNFQAGDLIGVEEITLTAEYTGDNRVHTSRAFTAHPSRRIYVPTDYPTIQAAIDAALDSDEIVLSDGVYAGEGNRNVQIGDKRIIIRSLNGPTHCIINAEDSSGKQSAFVFNEIVSSEKRISGITITNALSAAEAAFQGAYDLHNLVFENCVFTKSTYGTNNLCGIFTDCTFIDNTWGIYESSVQLENCTFQNNWYSFNRCAGIIFNSIIRASYGCGFRSSEMDVYNCIISGNDTGFYGCLGSVNNCVIAGNNYGLAESEYIDLENCILYKNAYAAILSATTELPAITCCNFFENTCDVIDSSGNVFTGADQINTLLPSEGNISADPLFEESGRNADFEWTGGLVRWIDGDYHLQHGSPCIDAGADVGDRLHTADPDGTPIPQDGDLDGTARADIGVYEYVQNIQPYIDVWEKEITLSGAEGTNISKSSTISIHNKGLSPLAWAYEADVPWLEIVPATGTIEGTSFAQIVVSANLESLAAGTYTGRVVFSGQDALNTDELTVTLIVGRVLHVPSDYATIQAAIDAAQDYDTILLADGIYTGDGNRDVAYGGKQVTITSQSGPANCIIDCQGSEADPHRAFIFDNGETPETILSGVSIVNGYAPDYVYIFENALEIRNYNGGAILIVNASPTITNCVVKQCTAGQGGGIFCHYASPVIINCTFLSNNAGGSAVCSYNSTLRLEGCLFSDNDSTWTVNHVHSTYYTVSIWGGGAVFAFDGSAVISNCIFAGNAGETSGAITAFNVQTVMTNCTLTGNRGTGRASLAAMAYDVPEPVVSKMIQIANCIFHDNHVSGSPEVLDGRGFYSFVGESSTPVMMQVSYSAFDALSPSLMGVGNIEADPLFVREGYWDDGGTPGEAGDDVWVEGDYHLQSEGWSWDVQSGQWMWNEATSPCIDAGHPAMALGDEPLTLAVDLLNRFGTNIRVNMGAYGGTAEASMAPEGWALRSDLDNSGRVTADDLAMVATMWLDAQALLPADTTRDGIVDAADLALMAEEWLKTALRLED